MDYQRKGNRIRDMDGMYGVNYPILSYLMGFEFIAYKRNMDGGLLGKDYERYMAILSPKFYFAFKSQNHNQNNIFREWSIIRGGGIFISEVQ
jgi:hypothetical protein